MIEDLVLNEAAQHAATHEKGIKLSRTRRFSTHYAHDHFAVVSVLVRYRSDEHLCAGCRLQGAQLLLRIAARREVELVRFLRELSSAAEILVARPRQEDLGT